MGRGIIRDDVTDNAGNAIQGKEVTIYIADTVTKATLYDASTGGSEIGNPVVTDEDGVFEAYADTGEYEVEIDGQIEGRYNAVDGDELADLLAIKDIGGLTTADKVTYDGESANVKLALDARVPTVATVSGLPTNPPVGSMARIKSRDNSLWEAVTAGSEGTPDGFGLISGTGVDWILRPRPEETVLAFGADDGVTTGSTGAVQASIDTLEKTIIPASTTIYSGALTITSNKHLVIDGTLKTIAAIGNNPLIHGQNVDNVRITGHGTLDGNRANVGFVESPGIFLEDVTNSIAEGITIKNCHQADLPGINGCGIWFERGSNCKAIGLTVYGGFGNGILFGAMDKSWSIRCVAYDNDFGSGVAHTRGTRACSFYDTTWGNYYSNITMNCIESQIVHPISHNSGQTGINIGHDREASDASRSILVGGISYDNNYEGVTITGSTEVTVIGTRVRGNGANDGANDRYGLRLLHNSFRCSIKDVVATDNRNSGLSIESGTKHSIEGVRSFANDRRGMHITVPDVKVIDCEFYNNNQLGDAVDRPGLELGIGSDRVEIDGCKFYDNQTVATQSWGVRVLDGDHSLTNCQITRYAVDDVDLAGGTTLEIRSLRLGDGPMSGSFTCAAGTTSTVIANDNARSVNGIILVPRNAAAAAFTVYPAAVTKGVDFTINHNSAAAGTETYAYKFF